jgi:2-C-methyl-D-erythritol 4-phosphate cytidylyltransferase
MSNFAIILPAAGQSRRFHDKAYKKPFAPLGGRAVWLHSAERFMNRADVKQVIVAIAADDRDFFNLKFGANIAILGVQVVEGGEHRTDSVQRATPGLTQCLKRPSAMGPPSLARRCRRHSNVSIKKNKLHPPWTARACGRRKRPRCFAASF